MKKLTTILFSAILMAGCTSEEFGEQQRVADGTLRFAPQMVSDWNAHWTRSAAADVMVQQLLGADGLYLHTEVSPGFESDRQQQEKVTRGTLVNNISSFGTNFGVSAYRYGTNESPTSANFFYKAEVKNTNDNWTTTTNFTWPASTDKIDFYGYAPYENDDVAVAADDASGVMKIVYTVNATPSAQADLMTAVKKEFLHETGSTNTVNMAFEHQLTAVKFVLGDNVVPGHIKQIKFENIATTGTLTVGIVENYDAANSWARGNLTNYTLDLTAGGTTSGFSTTNNYGNINQNAEITAETTPLLMIPQNFTQDTQRLVVTVNDGSTSDKELSVSLKNTAWLPNTTVTYKITTSSVNTLRLGTVTYPTMWGTEDISATFNKSAYQVGDKIGVYGVNAEGEVVFANKEYRLTEVDETQKWVAQDGANSLYVPGLTFYAYYPYQATLNGAPTTTSPDVRVTNELEEKVLPTPRQFFSDAIAAWQPSGDQGDVDKLQPWDLQVGVGTPLSASTVNISMTHAMGLAILTLEAKSSKRIDQYYLTTDADYKWTHDPNTTIPLTASSHFTGNKPCPKSGTETQFYYVLNGSADPISFTCLDTDDDSVWPTFTASVSNGTSAPVSVHLKSGDLTTIVSNSYIIAIGDVFFSDGAIGKSCSDYPERKAVGIILYNQTSTTDTALGFTHGYVISATDAACGVWATSGYDQTLVTGVSGFDSNYTGSNPSLNLYNFITGDMDGYTKCQTVKNRNDYTAARYKAIGIADGFNTSVPVTTPDNHCSGWYLPSCGQLFKFVYYFSTISTSTLAFDNTEWVGTVELKHYSPAWSDVAEQAINGFNSAFSSKGFLTTGDNVYTHISGTGSAASYWSSTEVDATKVYNLCPWTTNRLHIDGNDAKSIDQVFRVRPVLAF